MDRREEDGDEQPPSERIRAYVDALLSRRPDLTDDDSADSPWSDGPLINNAFGSAIYFGMVWSRAEEASEYAARLVEQHGLVCYDPQLEALRPVGAASNGEPRLGEGDRPRGHNRELSSASRRSRPRRAVSTWTKL